MRRRARLVPVMLAVAAAGGLAACSSAPSPKITVHGPAGAVTVRPSTYCSSPGHCSSAKLDIPVITVTSKGSVTIDVPSTVASHGWREQALSLDGQTNYGDSGPLSGQQSYQVAGNAAKGGPFVVQVNQLHNGIPDGSTWSFVVQVSA